MRLTDNGLRLPSAPSAPSSLAGHQDAYFDYDVETAPDRLLKQRRRWNNGIVAGIHYLINPFGELWTLSTKPWHLKMCNFLVMCQQYVLVMTVRSAPDGHHRPRYRAPHAKLPSSLKTQLLISGKNNIYNNKYLLFVAIS